jgi:hypothetical protein
MNEVYMYTELFPENNEEQDTEEDAPSLSSETSYSELSSSG